MNFVPLLVGTLFIAHGLVHILASSVAMKVPMDTVAIASHLYGILLVLSMSNRNSGGATAAIQPTT